LSSNNTSCKRVYASKLDQVFKCLEVAYLAGSPKVWWRTAHRFLEALQQGYSFCAGNVEVFHSFREGVQVESVYDEAREEVREGEGEGVKKGLEV
jgi:hypothetical protein